MNCPGVIPFQRLKARWKADVLARPLTLAGEMIGVLVFLQLLDAARTILKDAPSVRTRARSA